MKLRVGILTSHPIQYQAPWFRALAREVDLEVFFAHRQSPEEQGKAGFGVAFDWDVDLLSGYAHRFLRNVSRRPGVDHYSGCDTPEIAAVIGATMEDAGPRIEVAKAVCGPDARRGAAGSRRFDAFIVAGWYLKSYGQAARACRRAGIPVLARGDSQLRTPRSLLKRLIMEVWQRRRLRVFDGFLSVGVRHREYLQHFGVPAERIFFVPHFVDNDWFGARAAILRGERSAIRSKWNIPEEAFCVLFCGKFIRKKRPMDIVRAARLLLADGRLPNLHLLFVGSGELGEELRRSCRVAHDRENPQMASLRPGGLPALPPASFAGFLNQTQIPAAYVAADVLALPSDGGETWGLAVNEAMACGTAAVVSDAVGCAPDLIEEGRTGFTFPMGNSGELAERLERVARLKRCGHDFGAALRAKLERYSVATAVRGTLEALERSVRPAEGGRPGRVPDGVG